MNKSPESFKERRKRTSQKYYLKNKTKIKKYTKTYRKSAKDKLNDYKKTLFCNDCKLSFKEEPYLCDFHHIIDKKFSLSAACKSGWNMVKQELLKCIPLCCNCHRRRHVKEGFKNPSKI